MKLEHGKFYTHRNMLDCMIQILYEIAPNTLIIRWWLKNGYNLEIKDQVFIPENKRGNWREVVG